MVDSSQKVISQQEVRTELIKRSWMLAGGAMMAGTGSVKRSWMLAGGAMMVGTGSVKRSWMLTGGAMMRVGTGSVKRLWMLVGGVMMAVQLSLSHSKVCNSLTIIYIAN